MLLDKSEDNIILTSGRKIYAHEFIVGIDPDLNISGGYDNSSIDRFYNKTTNTYDKMTKEERTELADYMIALWTKYKDQP